MTKFLHKFKKSCLWSIFEAKRFFKKKKKIRLLCTTLYEFLTTCENLERKANDPTPRKLLDRSTFGQTE